MRCNCKKITRDRCSQCGQPVCEKCAVHFDVGAESKLIVCLRDECQHIVSVNDNANIAENKSEAKANDDYPHWT